jgi:hypothetical protein
MRINKYTCLTCNTVFFSQNAKICPECKNENISKPIKEKLLYCKGYRCGDHQLSQCPGCGFGVINKDSNMQESLEDLFGVYDFVEKDMVFVLMEDGQIMSCKIENIVDPKTGQAYGDCCFEICDENLNNRIVFDPINQVRLIIDPGLKTAKHGYSLFSEIDFKNIILKKESPGKIVGKILKYTMDDGYSNYHLSHLVESENLDNCKYCYIIIEEGKYSIEYLLYTIYEKKLVKINSEIFFKEGEKHGR